MEEKERRSLSNRLQKTLADATILICEEQEHHALCYRAIAMIEPYAQILPVFYKDYKSHFGNADKEAFIRWIQKIEITLSSGHKERSNDYHRTKRRTIIVLADIIESVVESVLVSCLDHLDTSNATVRSITGHRGKADSPQQLKFAVRNWERRLFSNIESRHLRFEHMIRHFLNGFHSPSNASAIDNLIDTRNLFTHEIIAQSKFIDVQQESIQISDEAVDNFFIASGDFVMSILTCVTSDLPNKIPALYPQ